MIKALERCQQDGDEQIQKAATSALREGEIVMDNQQLTSRVFDGSNGAPHRTVRVALYSHDAMGVGHVRRNLLIAQTLV